GPAPALPAPVPARALRPGLQGGGHRPPPGDHGGERERPDGHRPGPGRPGRRLVGGRLAAVADRHRRLRAPLDLRPHRGYRHPDNPAPGPAAGHRDRGLPGLRPQPRHLQLEVQQLRQLRRHARHPAQEPLRLGPRVLMRPLIRTLLLFALVAAATLVDLLFPPRPGVVMAAFNIFVQVGLILLSALISYALTPKPPRPKPASITDFDV